MIKLFQQIASAAMLAGTLAGPVLAQNSTPSNHPGSDGVVRVRSAYSMEETIARLRLDIAAKGILFFQAVDQAQLASMAGIKLAPSTLLEFGNPPLGAQFLTANPNAGLDWPVRLLVSQDANGTVWASWTDFAWIAKRHGITSREQQFNTAAGVVESITSTVRAN
jgi:uncharacterized protein (DUF302 family)